MAFVACLANAQENVTAKWDWQNNNPSGIQDNTNYDGVEADILSTVDGVYMHVDATNGKLNCVGRNNAQFNSGTILQVPVKSTKDIVTVTAYSDDYKNYTVGGVAATSAETVYKVLTADVEQGYVEVIATGTCYLYCVQVEFVSSIEEKELYSTSFTEWPLTDNRKTNYSNPDVYSTTTKYSHEDLTFELHGVGVDPEGTNSKFADYIGYMITAKYPGEEAEGEPYAITTQLASITKIVLTQCATGGTRGIKVSVKGDEDEDWAVIHNQSIGTASGEELSLDVNRTNCQIKFEAFALDQNAYVVDLAIYGYFDTSLTPALGSFSVNGTTYNAADIFDEDSDGNMAATVEVSKSDTMISESNPLQDITSDNGDITSISYETTDEGTVVTIVVSANGEEITYKLTVVYKPDFTVYYIDTDGSTLGTQTVEKDATIGTFLDLEDQVTVAEGKKYRGWFVSAKGGRKYTTDEVIVEDTYLYAVATDIETMSTTARYSYDLTNQYFYAEDHEAFMPTNGSYNNEHGWSFSNDGQIDILVGGHAYIMLALCKYGNSSTITISDPDGNVVGTLSAPVSTDGGTSSIEYTGGAGTLSITMSNGIYLHGLTIANVEDSPVEKNDEGYYVVKAGDAGHLLTTLDIANASASASERTYVFVPDGVYDLGNATLTPISGSKISIIGQSMENTIIMNTPDEEGIGVTATFLITGSYAYLQDLTLKNAYPYYTAGGSAGRAVCIQDKANRTICKNVRMLSYQDTYYSNNDAEFYFETSDIHGTVDFICGEGAVFFKDCTITVEKRYADGTGGCTITAPSTSASKKYGYVFDGCKIVNYAASYNYGRTWNGNPQCTYLNTTLLDPDALISTRWTTAGMGIPAERFFEYNTMDVDGNVISPETCSVTFTKSGYEDNTYNTILTESEAAEYALDKVFTSWTPDQYAAQKGMDMLTANGNILTWNAVDGAIAYAVFNNGEFVDIVGGTSYTVTDGNVENYTVRAANEYGGFGDPASTTSSNIAKTVDDGNILRTVYYNLQGARVSNSYTGLVIKVDTLQDGSQVSTKIIK